MSWRRITCSPQRQRSSSRFPAGISPRSPVSLTTGWIAWSFVLYAIAGACWLPVVWIQVGMRDLAAAAAANDAPLPPRYFALFRVWTILGMRAFIAFIAIFWPMVAKPA
jgi:uncharacterized membrane protein